MPDAPTGPARNSAHVLRPLSRDDIPQFLDIDQWAFAYDTTEKAVSARNFADGMDWDHVHGVSTGPDAPLAGVYGWLPFLLTVPGGRLPCAGVTAVGVHPLYRRQGCLRAMMQHHLADAAGAGRPVSALFAAEPAIYGRFGYGAASMSMRMTIGRGAALRELPGTHEPRLRMELVDPDRHAEELAECFESWRSRRPGTVDRYGAPHRVAPLLDPPESRHGAETLRVLVAEGRDGGPARGYALFRRKLPEDSYDGGTVLIRELVAHDPVTARALWRTLLDMDLMDSVSTCRLALDDPIVHLLVDSRAPKPTVKDNLWLRIVDVPAALAGRRYAAPIDTVLEVRDELVGANTGRWHLRGGPLDASCTRTQAPADLAMDVRELASAYLGGHSLAVLAAAGLVEELVPGALAPAATAMGWPVAPISTWCF